MTSAGTYHYEDCHRKGSEGEFLYRFPDLELARRAFSLHLTANSLEPQSEIRATYNHSGTTISNDM